MDNEIETKKNEGKQMKKMYINRQPLDKEAKNSPLTVLFITVNVYYVRHGYRQHNLPMPSIVNFLGDNVLHLPPSANPDQRHRICHNTRCGQLCRKVTNHFNPLEMPQISSRHLTILQISTNKGHISAFSCLVKYPILISSSRGKGYLQIWYLYVQAALQLLQVKIFFRNQAETCKTNTCKCEKKLFTNVCTNTRATIHTNTTQIMMHRI